MENDQRRQDDILIGRLIQSVETLTTEVAVLRTQMSTLQQNVSTGRGFLVGLLLFAGGVGATLSQVMQGFFK